MTNVELVIKIPEDVFKRTVFYREFRDLNDCITTIKSLEKAVPLPKGHGRLIDADKLHLPPEEMVSRMAVHYAPTVIEADDEVEE